MSFLGSLKRILIGNPLSTEEEHAQRLPKTLALAVFSSDALSSVAYATEEILKSLFPLLAFAAFAHIQNLAFAIMLLLLIVSTSYQQTIYAYPTGGGAYTVAKANL